MTRRDLWLWTALLVLPGLYFLSPLLWGRVFFIGDLTHSFHPWYTYAAQEIQAGRFPLWDPYSSGGQPFAANPQTLLFYPGAAMFWLFPFARAQALFLWTAQGALSGAVYLLARSRAVGASRFGAALAALAMAWGGFPLSHWEFPAVGATLPWVFFVVLFSAAGSWKILPGAVALLVFGGYTQIALYALLWSGLWVGWKGIERRRPGGPGAWALAVGAGLLLTLPILGPAWEWAGLSQRTTLTSQDARGYLLTPALLVKWIVPGVLSPHSLPFSHPAFGGEFWPVQRNWLSTFYIGTAPALLALTALFRRKKFPLFSALTGLFFLMLALGVNPLFDGVRHLVPGFRYMTHFSNAAFVPLAIGALLAAAAKENRRAPWATGFLFFLCLGMAAGPALRTALLRAMVGVPALTAAQDRQVQLAFLTTGLWAAGVWVVLRWRPRPRAVGLLGLTLLELGWQGRVLQPATNADFFHQAPTLSALGNPAPQRFALHPGLLTTRPMAGRTLEEGYQSLRQAGHPNTPLPYRVPMAWSYNVFDLREYTAFRRLVPWDTLTGPVVDFLSVATVASDRFLPPPFELLAREPQAVFYHNPRALPRFTAGQRPVVRLDPTERLAYLASPWDPRREVVLEKNVSGESGAVEVHASAEEPGRAVATGAGRPGWLVRNTPFYPGWECFINGQKTEIHRVNHAFQAVRVPEGPWRAVWVYRPHGFRWGLLLWVGGLGAALAARRRNLL